MLRGGWFSGSGNRVVTVENEHLQQFHQQGYFTVSGLLTDEEIQAVFAEVAQIVGRYPEPPGELVQFEPRVISGDVATESLELSVRKLFRMAVHNAFFQGLGRHPRWLEIVHTLLGPRVHLIQSMLLMKPPRCSTNKVWHQDNAYFRLAPCQLLGLWIACDKTSIENGCMHVVPFSQHAGLVEHRGSGDEYGAVTTPTASEVVAVPLRAGDALVFHGELLHATPANQTPDRRRALQYHYAAADCRQLSDDYPFQLPDPELTIGV